MRMKKDNPEVRLRKFIKHKVVSSQILSLSEAEKEGASWVNEGRGELRTIAITPAKNVRV